jgi:nucleotide-binding universal stress UspA family protein
MFKILIPTDFSEAAQAATEYGIRLAQRINAEVIIFHATGLPMLKTTEDADLLASRDLERIENEQLARLHIDLKHKYPEVIVATYAAIGFPVEEIKNCCKDNNIDLVIMGTKGAGGLKEILVGSNTATLIKTIDLPVLAVPINAVYSKIEKIVFATGLLNDDLNSIKTIIQLFTSQEPEITLLHIEDGHLRDAEANFSTWFHQEVLPSTNYPKLKAEVISETEIVKTLHTYLETNKVDLLVTATRKRNFIERIFDKSITTKLVYHTHIPLLALHTHGSKGEMIL